MATQQLINVQNTDIEVKSYLFSKKELDLDSGRNLNGYMERTVLGHHPRTIDIILPPCDRTQMHNYMVLFDRREITVKAFDIFTNQVETLICMHGDLSPDIYWNPDEMLYKDMKIQLVEY